MFKNLLLYRLPAPWNVTAAQIEEALTAQAFTPCTSIDMQRTGWVAPRPNGDLVHSVNQQMLLCLQTEKKLLPSSVVNQFVKARVAQIEEQEGFKPGRKRMKEIKEETTDELLPRAFSLLSQTRVWIDPVNGWLAIDAGSTGKAEEVLGLLIRAIERLPAEPVRVESSPVQSMTDWLVQGEAPFNFTIDQDTELRATGEGKATVRFSNQSVEADDVNRHITAGKRCIKLALTWKDRISFVLTENLVIRKIKPLEVLSGEMNKKDGDEAEVFDADFALMTGELNGLLTDLIDGLGGFKREAKAA